jgi:hypothetical protein
VSDLYDVARQVTDEVMGEGTYAESNAGNPDPGVQAAIERAARPEPTYKLTVTYALGHDQEHPGLTADAVEQGFVAFFHDLTYLKGAGIQRVSIEIEGERNERGGYVPGLG